MKAAIRQRALELGFDDCRFTTAAAPASAEQFQNWLAEKQHGEMAWLERNAPKRIDPQKVLPGAKSVIALAASYAMDRSADGCPRVPGVPSLGRAVRARLSPATPGLTITTTCWANG